MPCEEWSQHDSPGLVNLVACRDHRTPLARLSRPVDEGDPGAVVLLEPVEILRPVEVGPELRSIPASDDGDSAEWRDEVAIPIHDEGLMSSSQG